MGYFTKVNRKRKILGHRVKCNFKSVCTSGKNLSEVFSSITLKDCRCFLLGGGPSLKDFDYTCLKNEFTIGINKTFIEFSPTINYAMDTVFYKSLVSIDIKKYRENFYDSWQSYTGYKVFLCPTKPYTFGKDIYVIDRITGKTISLDFREGIYGGKNSGLGALLLAISMGCTEIYLLGYDLKISGKFTHWHEGYHKQNIDEATKRLKKFKKEFEEFAESIKDIGISVINLSQASALECFEKKDLKQVLTG